jgi:hypothetical protein
MSAAIGITDLSVTLLLGAVEELLCTELGQLSTISPPPVVVPLTELLVVIAGALLQFPLIMPLSMAEVEGVEVISEVGINAPPPLPPIGRGLTNKGFTTWGGLLDSLFTDIGPSPLLAVDWLLLA